MLQDALKATYLLVPLLTALSCVAAPEDLPGDVPSEEVKTEQLDQALSASLQARCCQGTCEENKKCLRKNFTAQDLQAGAFIPPPPKACADALPPKALPPHLKLAALVAKAQRWANVLECAEWVTKYILVPDLEDLLVAQCRDYGCTLNQDCDDEYGEDDEENWQPCHVTVDEDCDQGRTACFAGEFMCAVGFGDSPFHYKEHFSGFCPACAPPMTYSTDSGKCECLPPAVMNWKDDCVCPESHRINDEGQCETCAYPNPVVSDSGRECIPCSGSTPYWDGSSCTQCPAQSSPHWDSSFATATDPNRGCVNCVSEGFDSYSLGAERCYNCGDEISPFPNVLTKWNPETNECDCPDDKPLWKGGDCIACDEAVSGQEWIDGACACPDSGPPLNEDGTACACPDGEEWNPETMRCESECTRIEFTVNPQSDCSCGEGGARNVGSVPAGDYRIEYVGGEVRTNSGADWNTPWPGSCKGCGTEQCWALYSNFGQIPLGSTSSFSTATETSLLVWYQDNGCSDNEGSITYQLVSANCSQ